MDQDGVYFQSVLGGLVCDKVVTNHFWGEIFDLLRGFKNLHTTFQSTAEGTFSSSSSMNLSFQDKVAISNVKVSSDLFSLLRGGSNVSSLNEDSVFAH